MTALFRQVRCATLLLVIFSIPHGVDAQRGGHNASVSLRESCRKEISGHYFSLKGDVERREAALKNIESRANKMRLHIAEENKKSKPPAGLTLDIKTPETLTKMRAFEQSQAVLKQHQKVLDDWQEQIKAEKEALGTSRFQFERFKKVITPMTKVDKVAGVLFLKGCEEFDHSCPLSGNDIAVMESVLKVYADNTECSLFLKFSKNFEQ